MIIGNTISADGVAAVLCRWLASRLLITCSLIREYCSDATLNSLIVLSFFVLSFLCFLFPWILLLISFRKIPVLLETVRQVCHWWSLLWFLIVQCLHAQGALSVKCFLFSPLSWYGLIHWPSDSHATHAQKICTAELSTHLSSVWRASPVSTTTATVSFTVTDSKHAAFTNSPDKTCHQIVTAPNATVKLFRDTHYYGCTKRHPSHKLLWWYQTSPFT